MARDSHRLLRALASAAAGLSLAAFLRTTWRLARRFELDGRVAVVTGGSRGLGLLLAGRRGARVAICGRDPAALQAAERRLRAQGIDAIARRCDLGDRAEAEGFIEAVAAAWGRIDVLVNNAGVIHVEPAETMSLQSLDEAMRSNFYGAVHATFAALPHLREQPRACLVNVVSVGGRVAVPHLLGYTASKFALMGFSEGLSAELQRPGFRVVTIVPGLMRTGSFYNAEFAGRAERELAWFSVGASLPLLTVNARRAARRIVRAIENGERLVFLGWPAAVASFLQGVAPRLTLAAMTLADRLLPSSSGTPEPTRRGREIPSPFRGSPLLRLGDRAASNNNEDPDARA